MRFPDTSVQSHRKAADDDGAGSAAAVDEVAVIGDLDSQTGVDGHRGAVGENERIARGAVDRVGLKLKRCAVEHAVAGGTTEGWRRRAVQHLRAATGDGAAVPDEIATDVQVAAAV